MAMRKQGIIYMTMVIVFLVVMVAVFYTYELYKVGSREDTIETRIRTMNDFIDDLRLDAQRAAYIAGFRTMLALEAQIIETGSFLSDAGEEFKEPFYNGTIGNTTPDILKGQSFSHFLQGVNQQSGNIGISLNITVLQITFYQTDPWNVVVDILSTVNIIDNKGLAEWNFNETFTSKIPIEDLKDPIYSVNTLGRFQNFIKPTNISDFVSDDNKTANISLHIENGYYKASDKAPSFMMRFEGNLSDSTHGIESLVDISFLEKQEDIVVDYTRSIVDYIYFGNQSTNNKCNFYNMPSWFKMDSGHLSDYEVDQLSYSNC
ncbi:hypothetical protein HQ533_04365 [Candidatus Woesearchaeota archaeon]|nr:hypothetical protein [Candidatus Woesearchaeota archaeon]